MLLFHFQGSIDGVNNSAKKRNQSQHELDVNEPGHFVLFHNRLVALVDDFGGGGDHVDLFQLIQNSGAGRGFVRELDSFVSRILNRRIFHRKIHELGDSDIASWARICKSIKILRNYFLTILADLAPLHFHLVFEER